MLLDGTFMLHVYTVQLTVALSDLCAFFDQAPSREALGNGSWFGSVMPAPTPAPSPAQGESYVIDPTMLELEQHTQDAIQFAQDNEDTVDARAVLISAWNE